MKIWVISQDENNTYDTFDSAVVAAETEEEARRVIPNFGHGKNTDNEWDKDGNLVSVHPVDGTKRRELYPTWARNLSAVQVEYLGEAKEGIEAGTILGSFNAG